jgi:hypothetical protein
MGNPVKSMLVLSVIVGITLGRLLISEVGDLCQPESPAREISIGIGRGREKSDWHRGMKGSSKY